MRQHTRLARLEETIADAMYIHRLHLASLRYQGRARVDFLLGHGMTVFLSVLKYTVLLSMKQNGEQTVQEELAGYPPALQKFLLEGPLDVPALRRRLGGTKP